LGELKRALDGENVKRKGLERGYEKAWRERKRQIRKHKKCSVILTDHGAQ
jgi:adenylylsulfate kinase-like enzyme